MYPVTCWLLSLLLADPSIHAGQLRLNQIQVVGTHNSYHLRPNQSVFNLAVAVQPDAKEWDYSRETLDQQLDHGVRNFELDMHLVGDVWHVMHVPVLDPQSTVRDFAAALTVVKAWSDKHPRHVPISFLMELKAEGTMLRRGIRVPEKKDVEQIDAIILQTFPRERVITPDDVRGTHKTLPEAIKANGWPTLSDAAGKVFFILHERGKNQELYVEGHPALEGRMMFVNAEPGEPVTATTVLDNPRDRNIPSVAKEGYIIRTRADTQGRRDDKGRQLALEGGAHILSTDYPLGEIEETKAFFLPGKQVARPNPVTAPDELKQVTIVEPIPAPPGK